jgi:hypothetical protein
VTVFTLALLAFASGCAPVGHARSVVLPQATIRPVSRIDAISDYDRAVATIFEIFRRDLGFPAFPVTFQFYPERRAFEAALLAVGYDAALARDTANAMGAIGGYRRVLLNESTLVPLSWPARVGLLAHEMTHSLQYEWGGGVRGRSDQWLREGFAEWVAIRVLERLGAVSLDDVRRQRRDELRRIRRARAPALDELATFPQWVAVSSRSGAAPYAHAFLAVDSLIERHGINAIAQYFRLFVLSQDRATNFRIAFGDDLATFESALGAQLR